MAKLDLSILEPYCENDMQLLKKISKPIFKRFGEQLSEADYSDFYSIANMTLWQAYNIYSDDMGISFDIFLRTCLKKKFATEIRDRHRGKRVINQLAYSLDQMVDNERDFSLIDTIASDFDTFEEVMKRQNRERFIDKVQEYMSSLSNQQINILNLLIDGYTGREIQKMLDISDREYTSNLTSMRSYEKVKALF